MALTFEELLALVPAAMAEMRQEFIRKSHEYRVAEGPTSQRFACFMLALRALSLCRAMGTLLAPETLDSYDVLLRAFLESRDLLTTFRFENEKTKRRVHDWFKGKGNTWTPEHKAVEGFLNLVGANDLQLARRWGRFSALSHPTFAAAKNSNALIAAPMSSERVRSIAASLDEKRFDYVNSLMSLYIGMCVEAPGWVHLGCEQQRMLRAEALRVLMRESISSQP